MTRDYTMNALYLEIFGNPPHFIDPTGRGFQDANKKVLHLVNPDDFKEHDLGGQFRYYKDNPPIDGELAQIVSKESETRQHRYRRDGIVLLQISEEIIQESSCHPQASRRHG